MIKDRIISPMVNPFDPDPDVEVEEVEEAEVEEEVEEEEEVVEVVEEAEVDPSNIVKQFWEAGCLLIAFVCGIIVCIIIVLTSL